MRNKKMLKVVSLIVLATTCIVSGAFAFNTKVANAETEDVFHELGASVRISTDDKGMRFAFGLPENKTGDGYEIGTLMIPKEILGGEALNHNEDESDEVDIDYQEVCCSKTWVPNDTLEGAKDGYKYYNAVLTEIPNWHYNTVVVARSYYKKDGVYTYSEPVERCIGYVASAALNYGEEDEDSNQILTDIVIAGYGETALSVELANDLVTMDEEATLTASNEKGYLPIWSSSNEAVATVDRTGEITAVRGGETTVTATIGNVSAEKKVYVLGDGLYSDQIGMRIGGYQYHDKPAYFNMATGENGEMIITAQFSDSAAYYPMLMLRNMYSKAYYQALVSNGYTKLAFNLAVEGDISDLYVFGKALNTFPENEGIYAIVIDVEHIVTYYDNIYGIATTGGQAGQAGSLDKMLIAWKSPLTWAGSRNYVFTISNPEFRVPTLDMDFAAGSKEIVAVAETTTLVAAANVNGDIVWSSSNNEVATVENGVVTGVKGGEVTITATLGNLTASKTIYVVGDGLYGNQIGVHAYGWNQTSNVTYFNMEANDGDMVATAKFAGSTTHYPALVLRELYSKAYYETLIAEGYTKLTYSIEVGGENAADVSDLYVFGNALTQFPKIDGEYKVVVDLQYIVDNYAKVSGIGTSVEAKNAEVNYMFLAWKSTAWTARNYIFTISDAEFRADATVSMNGEDDVFVDGSATLTATTNWDESFVVWSSSDESIATVENGVVTAVKGGETTITATVDGASASKTIYVLGDGLYSDQIGMRIGGYQYHDKPAYFNMATGENGEMTITAKFSDSAAYYPMLMLRNMYSKAYYQALVSNGYTKLAFNLAVEGDISDLYVFGKALNTFPENEGIYAIVIDVEHIVTYYDNIYGIATTGGQAGQAGSLDKMLIAWKSPLTWSGSRNYVFTISNAAFMSTPTLDVNTNDVEIAYGETATLIATTNWDESFVVWSSSDETIATVENGVVTVTGENWGEVTITATIAGVSVDTIITVNAPTQLEVEFAVESKDVITINGTTTLEATTDWNVERVVWSSSNNEVATVENGVVTGVKGGEVTITATIGDLTASKTVYVVGNTLDTDSFAVIAGAWNQPTYITTTTGENDEMVITAQFKGDQWRWPAVVLRNLESKAYYEKLIAEGYTKFVFNLAIGGANAADVSDLYIFGQLLSAFPVEDGVYTIAVDVQNIVNNYDTIGILGTSVEAVPSKYHAQMLISWKCTASNASTTRNYKFTISNGKYLYKEGDLYSNQLGIHAYGWNQTSNSTYFNMARGNNGEMIVSAKFAGSTTHYPAVVLRELFNKEYYQNLIAEGYKKLTFSLAVGGESGASVSDLYIFGKALTSFAKNSNGAYTVVIDLQYIVDNYAKVSGIGTSVEAKNAEVDYMFLAWKSTNWETRNYKFTISNPIYVKGVLFSDDFGFRDGGVNETYNGMKVDTGANGEIIIDATFTATATYGSFLMFNKMDTITYLGGLKGKYASFTFELTVEGGAVNDLHTFGTAKAISTCNKVSGKDNTYVVEIRLDTLYFTDSNWKSNMNTFITSTGQAGLWDARSQMLLAWRYNGSSASSGFKNPGNHEPRNYKFTIANFELRESLLYTY